MKSPHLLTWAASNVRIAIGIRGRVSALQAHLMREVAIRPGQEEVFIKFDSTLWLGVDLHHPALDPIGIELVIDCAVERIGEVDTVSITTDLHHLRSTIKRLTALRMRSA